MTRARVYLLYFSGALRNKVLIRLRQFELTRLSIAWPKSILDMRVSQQVREVKDQVGESDDDQEYDGVPSRVEIASDSVKVGLKLHGIRTRRQLDESMVYRLSCLISMNEAPAVMFGYLYSSQGISQELEGHYR